MSPSDLHELTRTLLADPVTSRLAAALELPVDEYVELVLAYVANPEAADSLFVVSDESLAELGEGLLTEAGVAAWFSEREPAVTHATTP